MMLKIILAFSIIPVWPMMFFILRNNTKPKKNIILGVTLPYEAHNDPEVQAICRAFRTSLTVVMLPILPLSALLFLMPSAGAAMTAFMTLLLVLITAPYAVFGVYRSKLMALKRARCWSGAAAGMRLADVNAAAIPAKKTSGVWFFLPLVISLVPVVLCLAVKAEWGNTLVYLTFALMVPVFWLCHCFIYRVRSEVVNDNLTLTMALTRVRRYNWSKFFLVSAWLTAVLNVLLWLLDGELMAFLILILAYTVILIVVSMQTEFAARAAQQKLTEDNVGELYLDEDEYWILGILYHNPHDKHFLVNDRVGVNMTMNLARPAAKVLAAFAVLVILAMPFLGIWMSAEEGTPATLILSETALTARHTSDEYVIELNTIESVSLIENLPSMTKTMGTNFDNLYKGRFSAGGYGACLVCMQPKDPPFLVVKAEGKTYLLNDDDSAVTKAVYDALAKPGASQSGEPREQYNTRAEAFVTAMAKGDFDAAAAMFDATMKNAINASKLETDVWKVVTKQAGAFVAVHAIENTKTEGYFVCFITSKHENSGVMLRVVFSGEGEIAGLFIEGYPTIKE